MTPWLTFLLPPRLCRPPPALPAPCPYCRALRILASDSSAELMRRVEDASDIATPGSSTPSEPHMSSRGLDTWARRLGLRAGPDPRTCLRPDDDLDPSQGRQLKSRPPLYQSFRAAVPTPMVREAADAWLGQLDEPSRSTRKRGNSHLPLTAEGAGQQRRRG